jgi:hypothetical protein
MLLIRHNVGHDDQPKSASPPLAPITESGANAIHSISARKAQAAVSLFEQFSKKR